MKKCKDCLQIKPLEEMQKHKGSADGHNALCKTCNGLRVKEWRKANPEKRATQQVRESQKDYTRNKHLKHSYGIDLIEYNRMFAEQHGQCYICHRHQSEFIKRLFVDHCHTTGKVRSLLCQHCNMMLGAARDNIEILKGGIAYLNTHSTTGY